MMAVSDFGQVISRFNRRSIGSAALILVALASAGCNSSAPPPGAAAGAGRGAMPAMPVEAVTLKEQPVEQSSEFVGTVKSRRSTNIKPRTVPAIVAITSGPAP